MRIAVAAYSRQLGILHDQMEAFGDPDAAELIGKVLDQGVVSFSELHNWVKTPAHVRSLTIVARARLIRETVEGIKAEPIAEEIASKILTAAEI